MVASPGRWRENEDQKYVQEKSVGLWLEMRLDEAMYSCIYIRLGCLRQIIHVLRMVLNRPSEI